MVDLIKPHLVKFLQYKRLGWFYMLKNEQPFNRWIQGMFIYDFFKFMDEQIAEKEKYKIKNLAQDYLDMLQISKEEYSIDSLLRMYRRYRNE